MRAKFKCNAVTERADGFKTAVLNPVTNGSEENESFSKYTPSGQLTIEIDPGTPAVDFFTPGKEYYLDFTAAPTGSEG